MSADYPNMNQSSRRGLVVGGGIVGAHCALAMALRGWSVTLCEASATPAGPSVRSLGLVRMSGRADGAELRDAVYGRQRWLSLARRIDGLGIQTAGTMTLLYDEVDTAVAEAYQRRYGDRIDLDVLTPQELRKLAPEVKADVAGALFCRDDMVIDPPRTVPRLLEYLENAEGVDVRRATEVTALERVGPHVVATTRYGPIHTDVAIACVGNGRALLDDSADEELTSFELEAIELNLGMQPSYPTTDSSAFLMYPGYRSVNESDKPEPDHEWAAVAHPSGSTMVGILRHRPGVESDATIEDLVERTVEVYRPPQVKRGRQWRSTLTGHVDQPFHRSNPEEGIYIISAFGKLGNTLAPSIALQVVEQAAA